MSASSDVNRIVVVCGPGDPVLNSTLLYVGLEVLYTHGDVTVWGPLDLGPDWLDELFPDPDAETLAAFGWVETPALDFGCEHS